MLIQHILGFLCCSENEINILENKDWIYEDFESLATAGYWRYILANSSGYQISESFWMKLWMLTWVRQNQIIHNKPFTTGTKVSRGQW